MRLFQVPHSQSTRLLLPSPARSTALHVSVPQMMLQSLSLSLSLSLTASLSLTVSLSHTHTHTHTLPTPAFFCASTRVDLRGDFMPVLTPLVTPSLLLPLG